MYLSKEDQSRGGKTAQSKVYYCHKCGGIGQGSSMVNNHLVGECNGKQGRKLKKATERNSHRLEEALHNTKVWRSEKINEEVREFMKANQESVRANIEELYRSIQVGLGDVMENYYKNIF